MLAPFLAAAGHDVVGLDTFFYRGCDFGAEASPVPGRDRDVRDVTPADLDGFDAIVHLAALSNDPLGDLDPSLTEQINGDATLRLATAAREAGVRRFVFASSCSMYGASGTRRGARRGGAAAAADAVRRVEGSLRGGALRARRHRTSLPSRCATRPCSASRRGFGSTSSSTTSRRWAHTTGRIRLLSDGMAWRPLVHVRDIAKATLALLDAPEEQIRGEAFNVGTDEQNYLDP